MAERKALNGSRGSPPKTGAARLETASVSAIHEAPKKTSSAWRRLVLLVSFCLACASSSAKHLSQSQQLLASLARTQEEGMRLWKAVQVPGGRRRGSLLESPKRGHWTPMKEREREVSRLPVAEDLFLVTQWSSGTYVIYVWAVFRNKVLFAIT